MTQEDRKLLLTDLCARSPYGVICQFIWTYSDETTGGKSVTAKEDDNIRCIDIHTKEIQADYYGEWVDLEHCKPYLRPMSSMTEEEKTELQEVVKSNPIRPFGELTNKCDNLTRSVAYGAADIVSYLLSKHFDIYNLIERGLALEAPEGMYKIKEK